MQTLFDFLQVHALIILLQNNSNFIYVILINLINIIRLESLELSLAALKQQSQHSLIQVANIVNKLTIYLSLEITPFELSVWVLRSYRQQVESPSKDWYLRNINNMGTKNTCAISLWKFNVLIVQVLSCAYLIQ